MIISTGTASLISVRLVQHHLSLRMRASTCLGGYVGPIVIYSVPTIEMVQYDRCRAIADQLRYVGIAMIAMLRIICPSGIVVVI